MSTTEKQFKKLRMRIAVHEREHEYVMPVGLTNELWADIGELLDNSDEGQLKEDIRNYMVNFEIFHHCS